MEAGGWALAVRERSGEDFDAGGEKGAELIEAGLVGAKALADEESLRSLSQTRSPASVVAGDWISAKVGMCSAQEVECAWASGIRVDLPGA